MFLELWNNEIVMNDLKLCTYIFTAICHLGCGAVNTVQMVEEGCGKILYFVVECHKNPKYASYRFSELLLYRCSAAIRNMLCIQANHEIIVENGCLDVLVYIAGLNPNHLVSNNHIAMARENSSVSLKSTTYNTSLRDKLVSNGAINIILRDVKVIMKGDSLPINHSLLAELEAESWSNGSRGTVKEGRSAAIEPDEIVSDLLQDTIPLKLDLSAKTSDICKYLVHVHLEEPPIDAISSAKSTSSQQTFQLKDLKAFKDTENSHALQTCVYLKEPCECRQHTIQTLKPGAQDSRVLDPQVADDDYSTDSSSDVSDAPVRAANPPNAQGSIGEVENTMTLPPEVIFGREKPPSTSSLLSKPKTPIIKSRSAKGLKHTKAADKLRMKASDPLPELLAATGSIRRTSPQFDPVDQFEKLIQIINHSKKMDGALISEISNKWNSLSQF